METWSREKGAVSEKTLYNFTHFIWECRDIYQNKGKVNVSKLFTKWRCGKTGSKWYWHLVVREEPPTKDEIIQILRAKNAKQSEYGMEYRNAKRAERETTESKEMQNESKEMPVHSITDVQAKMALIEKCLNAGGKVCIIL